METALAELLGYEDCGLQAIRYLIEVQHLDADSSIVVEILRLLTSKLRETTESTSGCLSRSDPPLPFNLSPVEDTGHGRSSGKNDPPGNLGSSPKQQIRGGEGRVSAAASPSPGLCEDLGGVTVTNASVEAVDLRGCGSDTGSDGDVSQKPALIQNDVKEFGRWLTGLAKRHPAIEKLLLELTQLIDVEDGP